jgi:hypothetical protein
VLAAVHGDPERRAFQQLAIALYALQHPGPSGPGARTSTRLHLESVAAALGRDAAVTDRTAPDPGTRWLTVQHLLGSGESEQLLREWAASVLDAWSAPRLAEA